MSETETERRTDYEVRQAVDNIQNRFLERVGDKVARGLSMRELGEELVIGALLLTDATYGCVLRVKPAQANVSLRLKLDAVVSLESAGSLTRQHDTLLHRQPDSFMLDAIASGEATFSNDAAPMLTVNLPSCHPRIRSFALLPVRENMTIKALLFIANTELRFDLVLINRLQSMLDAFMRVHLNSIVNRSINNAIADNGQASRQLVTLLNATFDGIMTIDEYTRVTAFNPACERMFGVKSHQVLGSSVSVFLPADVLNTLRQHAATYYHTLHYHEIRPTIVTDVAAVKADGRSFTVELAIFHTRIKDQVYTTLIFHDITEQHLAEKRLTVIAHHDALTGLPNRTSFLQQLHLALDNRKPHGILALLFIDLDGFKAVNDALGHDAGDELLQQVASRIRQSVRAEDIVARLGSDEFTVILRTLDNSHDASTVADTIVHALRQPFTLQMGEVYVSASVGISLATGMEHSGSQDANSLIKQADVALYRAKLSGRSRYFFFTPELDQAQRDRSLLVTSLRRAVGRQDFELFYQPQLLIREQRLLGFEALLRWPQDTGEHVYPDAFIHVLEETGLISELGEWAIAQACGQHRIWLRQGLIGPATTMSVNVSARQLGMPSFAQSVAVILDRYRMRPDSLILEITESALVQTIETNIINDIKQLGVQISLDDFGTGYSSLAYLSQLPLDHLKIDRSFIADISRFPHAVTVIKSILALARTLGIRVIAEGVEDGHVLSMLAHEGCEGYQGYHFSRPLPACEMATRLLELEPVRLSHYANFIDLHATLDVQ